MTVLRKNKPFSKLIATHTHSAHTIQAHAPLCQSSQTEKNNSNGARPPAQTPINDPSDRLFFSLLGCHGEDERALLTSGGSRGKPAAAIELHFSRAELAIQVQPPLNTAAAAALLDECFWLCVWENAHTFADCCC